MIIILISFTTIRQWPQTTLQAVINIQCNSLSLTISHYLVKETNQSSVTF